MITAHHFRGRVEQSVGCVCACVSVRPDVKARYTLSVSTGRALAKSSGHTTCPLPYWPYPQHRVSQPQRGNYA